MAEAATLLRGETFNSKLNPFLDDVNKLCVAINDDSRKLCVNTTLVIVKAIINKLKNDDPVFNYFYNDLAYVGSYFDGLRVTEATEFDINMILRIPCYLEKIKVEKSHVISEFVRLNVENAIFEGAKLNSLPCANEWKKWIDNNGYLYPVKILAWMDSVFSKIFNNGKLNVNNNGKTYEVTRSKNGPANTLHISERNFQIDVDLVPVIQFRPTVQPPSSVRWFQDKAAPWEVVPKPMADQTLWRLSFAEQERYLLHGQKHLKFVNRFLKRFRDVNNLDISSYYIKSLFLWEAYEQKRRNNAFFWEKPVSYLFVYMLVKLMETLETKTLKFFWEKNTNMYQSNSDETLENMKGFVKRVILTINALIEQNDQMALQIYIRKLFGIN